MERGDRKAVKATFRRTGGMCPRCEGRGSVSDIAPARLYDASKSLAEGALTVPGSTGGGWNARPYAEHRLGGRDISEVLAMSVAEAEEFFCAGEARTPAAHAVLRRLADVGLGNLKLGQLLTTLSGGERQRLKLAAHKPAEGGDGVYVLDEPTAGLHLADVEQLLATLDRLVGSGTSVAVVEHHQAVMAHADWIIDLGPGAGHDRGRVVFGGTPAGLVAARTTRPHHPHSRTPRRLRRHLTHRAGSRPRSRRAPLCRGPRGVHPTRRRTPDGRAHGPPDTRPPPAGPACLRSGRPGPPGAARLVGRPHGESPARPPPPPADGPRPGRWTASGRCARPAATGTGSRPGAGATRRGLALAGARPRGLRSAPCVSESSTLSPSAPSRATRPGCCCSTPPASPPTPGCGRWRPR
ncbi:hypothetical protein GCM10023082_25510 [Streptomyces tremellae]|uniref:UvrABC system protein A n=1 Tax=Streptomyces tremellae TaxID=1124239 RepID=A0ABP7EYI9_9ACTN